MLTALAAACFSPSSQLPASRKHFWANRACAKTMCVLSPEGSERLGPCLPTSPAPSLYCLRAMLCHAPAQCLALQGNRLVCRVRGLQMRVPCAADELPPLCSLTSAGWTRLCAEPLMRAGRSSPARSPCAPQPFFQPELDVCMYAAYPLHSSNKHENEGSNQNCARTCSVHPEL